MSHFGPTPEELRAVLEPLGPWAFPVFVLGYALGTVLALPGALLTVAAALLFGFWKGLAATVLGATLGASGAFQIARTLGRGAVSRWLERRGEALRRVDRSLAEHGATAVFLLRVLPVLPFNVLNYACGLTAIRFPSYALATVLGILPGSFTYVYATVELGRPGAGFSAGTLGAVTLLLALLVGLPAAYRHFDKKAEGKLLERLAGRRPAPKHGDQASNF